MDPTLGRFLSADPVVQESSNTQNYNRYFYVQNNPLSYTDPTGFFFKGIAKAVGRAFRSAFRAIGQVFKAALRSGILRVALQAAACGYGAPASPLCHAAVVGLPAAETVALGGSLSDAARASAFSAASAAVFTGVGAGLDIAGIDGLNPVARLAIKAPVHGVVGGALSVAQGGSFRQGFIANAAGAAGGVLGEGIFGPAGSGSLGAKFGRTMVAAVAGGSASVLTGGKFANGAATAAITHFFNSETSCVEAAAQGCANGGTRGAIAGASAGCVATGPGCPGGALAGAVSGAAGGCAAGAAIAGAACVANNLLDKARSDAPPSPRVAPLYHYTTEAGMADILSSGFMRASTYFSGTKDVRYGNGVYVSDIAPGTRRNAQMARSFVGHPFSGSKFGYFFGINATVLTVRARLANLYVIQTKSGIFVRGRILAAGQNKSQVLQSLLANCMPRRASCNVL